MIDVRRLRTELDAVKTALARKNVDSSDVQRAADLDSGLRNVVERRDDLRARKNALSKDVGEAFKAGEREKAEALKAESAQIDEAESTLAAEASRLQDELRDLLLRIPNLPSPDAPDGVSEEQNVVVRIEGFDPDAYGPHQRVPHWDIGRELGILDAERAVKISGSMFVMLRGLGATMSRAMCQLFLDRGADAFEEIRPPTFVKTDTLVATGQLPKFADEAYHIGRDDLWPIPTAEVPLTSLARDEILDEAALPMRMMAYTPCYRREAGAAGRDTRGMKRSHEFDKVELLAYTTPEQAPALHAEILGRAESLLKELGLPYRVLDICTGDLGQSHARQFDLEVYSPGSDSWEEVSSISWFSDYQARRANIRYRPASGKGTEFSTLNGFGVHSSRLPRNRRPGRPHPTRTGAKHHSPKSSQ